VDRFIQEAPEAVRPLLRQIRETVLAAVPEATERIAYNMPTARLGENLLHYAHAKRHVGLYPTSSAVTAFAGRLSGYQTSRGAIRLPLDRPLPLGLIADIARFRAAEARERAAARAQRRAK
jgi:uncharacterized protein YdhG (YjbR/CyaY superfamily)